MDNFIYQPHELEEHPLLADWRYAVANGDTFRSFAAWLIEQEANGSEDWQEAKEY